MCANQMCLERNRQYDTLRKAIIEVPRSQPHKYHWEICHQVPICVKDPEVEGEDCVQNDGRRSSIFQWNAVSALLPVEQHTRHFAEYWLPFILDTCRSEIRLRERNWRCCAMRISCDSLSLVLCRKKSIFWDMIGPLELTLFGWLLELERGINCHAPSGHIAAALR
jgi:hypothetical protein